MYIATKRCHSLLTDIIHHLLYFLDPPIKRLHLSTQRSMVMCNIFVARIVTHTAVAELQNTIRAIPHYECDGTSAHNFMFSISFLNPPKSLHFTRPFTPYKHLPFYLCYGCEKNFCRTESHNYELFSFDLCGGKMISSRCLFQILPYIDQERELHSTETNSTKD